MNINMPTHTVVHKQKHKNGSTFCTEHFLTYVEATSSQSCMLVSCDQTLHSCRSIITHNICDQICQKGTYTRTVSRHTIHHHLLATSMHQQHTCLILLKVERLNILLSLRPLPRACLASMSAWVAFKWPHLPLASRQPTVNHHMTG